MIYRMSAMINYFRYLFRRRVEADRRLVQGKFSTVLRICLVVMCLPLCMWIILCGLAWIGAFHVEELVCEEALDYDAPRLWWAVLFHFFDPGNQHMSFGVGRGIALFLALSGSIFMNGILISSIVGWYDRYVDKWKCGLARYEETLKRKRFVVIIGAHECVPNIIKQLFERKVALDYVVVQTKQDVEVFRARLVSFLPRCYERKVILYQGERTSRCDMMDLCLDKVQEVIIIGDSEEFISKEANRDALNMACLRIMAEQLLNRRQGGHNRMICRIFFECQTTFSIFQYSDISDEIKRVVDFKTFNVYELWAQKVFVNRKLFFREDEICSGFLPLEGSEPITEDSMDTVHLVIIGMSQMGMALAVEAARLAHFPNFVSDAAKRTCITFIDEHCHTEGKCFRGRYRELFSVSRWREMKSNDNGTSLLYDSEWKNETFFEKYRYLGKDFIDIEWEFIEGGIEDADIYQYLHSIAEDSTKRLTVAICIPNDNEGISSALYLPESVYEKSIQVLVYQRHESSIIDSIALHNKLNQYYQRLKAFGMLSEIYDDVSVRTQEYIVDLLDTEYGKMYSEVKRIHNMQEVAGISMRGKSAISKYWSNVYNCNSIWGKLRSVRYGFTHKIEDCLVGSLAVTEHNRWVIEQLLMHYRPLNEAEQEEAIRDPRIKEILKGSKMAHLDICSYERLKEIDADVVCFDEGFIRIIPDIVESVKSI